MFPPHVPFSEPALLELMFVFTFGILSRPDRELSLSEILPAVVLFNVLGCRLTY